MFGKKKQPSLPYVLQVLTTEYLIEGTVDGDTHLYLPKPGVGMGPLDLTCVRIQATSPLDIPTRTCARFMVMGNNAVALIPQIEITSIAMYEVWKEYKKPLLGVFYVGPYIMQGKLMSLVEKTLQSDMPMYDVHITSQFPGAHWGEIYAPFALVNICWLHGYELS
jgi:hypothetical protein